MLAMVQPCLSFLKKNLQLLSELDGADHRSGVIVIGATNQYHIPPFLTNFLIPSTNSLFLLFTKLIPGFFLIDLRLLTRLSVDRADWENGCMFHYQALKNGCPF